MTRSEIIADAARSCGKILQEYLGPAEPVILRACLQADPMKMGAEDFIVFRGETASRKHEVSIPIHIFYRASFWDIEKLLREQVLFPMMQSLGEMDLVPR